MKGTDTTKFIGKMFNHDPRGRKRWIEAGRGAQPNPEDSRLQNGRNTNEKKKDVTRQNMTMHRKLCEYQSLTHSLNQSINRREIFTTIVSTKAATTKFARHRVGH
jgi:hypothetical protein